MPEPAAHSIAAYIAWTGLELEGLGCNLQHYDVRPLRRSPSTSLRVLTHSPSSFVARAVQAKTPQADSARARTQDQQIAREWSLPDSWVLKGELVFGQPGGQPGEKAFQPIADRVKVAGQTSCVASVSGSEDGAERVGQLKRAASSRASDACGDGQYECAAPLHSRCYLVPARQHLVASCRGLDASHATIIAGSRLVTTSRRGKEPGGARCNIRHDRTAFRSLLCGHLGK
jgi:hypothetical protein